MLQAVVYVEATARIGGGPHERSQARTTQRNGSRDKLVTTAAGDRLDAITCTSSTTNASTALSGTIEPDPLLRTVRVW